MVKSDLKKVLEKIYNKFNPRSIFIYGSQVNGDTNLRSDYEVGVIFDEENYISRSTLKDQIATQKISIYPFKYNELLQYKIDTPFEKNIYIFSLINGGAKTIFGENIIENMVSPKINKIDLIKDTCFNLGVALSAVQVNKENNTNLAHQLMYKSFFYSLRNLLFLKTGTIINGYNNIYKAGQKLNLPEEYLILIETCHKLRNESADKINQTLFFKNISFINKYVLELIEKDRLD